MRNFSRGYCVGQRCGGAEGTRQDGAEGEAGSLKDVLREREGAGHLQAWVSQALHVDCSAKRA